MLDTLKFCYALVCSIIKEGIADIPVDTAKIVNMVKTAATYFQYCLCCLKLTFSSIISTRFNTDAASVID